MNKSDELSVQRHFKSQLITHVRRLMKRQNMTQSELARRMGTSRAIVHRLLNPNDLGITLGTIGKAAAALGQKANVRLAA